MRFSILAILITAGLISVSIFGFWAMSFVDHNAQHSCPITLISESDCPPGSSGIAIASHYAAWLQNLTRFTVNAGIASLIFALLLAFVYLRFSKLPPISSILRALSFQRYYSIFEPHFTPRESILFWLAFRNKRDLNTLTGCMI